FDPELCANCPFHLADRCRAKPQKRDPRFTLRFTQKAVFVAQRRRRHLEFLRTPGNPRASIEATVRSVKHPFRQGKLPVRGLFRVTCMVIASAAMCNVRRIARYLADNDLWRPFLWSDCVRRTRTRPFTLPFSAANSDIGSVRRFFWRPLCRRQNTCFSF
ncbi:MAG: transposase, partial [Sedimenticola sp.]|nr:transposase [Sedimenticola sp.]